MLATALKLQTLTENANIDNTATVWWNVENKHRKCPRKMQMRMTLRKSFDTKQVRLRPDKIGKARLSRIHAHTKDVSFLHRQANK